MKILITTDLFSTETNGVVTSVKNLYDELTKKGHQVYILTISNSIHSHRENHTYYIRSMPFAIYPDVRMPISYHHRLIKELIDWKPDIIHSQCEFFSFQFAQYISKNAGAPIVHTYHTMYEQYVKYLIPSQRVGNQVVRVVSKNRLKGVKKVIAPTHKVETALYNYGIKAEIAVVPSGISLEQHKKRLAIDERLKARNTLGIKNDDLVLINLGRLGHEKNLGELLKLFSIATTKKNNLKFLIVGDGPARHDLEQMAHDLNISDNTIFTGMVNPSEVQSYYQLGDIFVSASTSETQGLTYVEAAANGLPLLCRNDLCLQDVIIQGKNGFAYNNAKEFLKHLSYIINNPEWRKTASQKSEHISKSFDKAVFGNKIEQIYKEVLKKS